jgi:O-antigen/teichoic acid export membrane protein
VKVEYILTNWKLRLAFIVVCIGIGVWEASIFHWNYLLAVVVGVAIALLRIWLEVRQHERG